jgi:ADP-heptose:LPS heptosyltransferase
MIDHDEKLQLANFHTAEIECEAQNTRKIDCRRVLVKVHGGIGDALMSLPIIRRLSEKYNVEIALRDPKKCEVGEWVEDILANNPFVHKLIYWKWMMEHLNQMQVYEKVILLAGHLLDQEIFWATPMHRIEFMGNTAGVNDCNPHDINIFLTEDEDTWAKNKLEDIKNPVIIQPTILREPWPNNQGKQIPIEIYPRLFRDFPELTFIGLGTRIEGYGDMADLGKWDNYISFVNNTTIRQSIALLKHSKFYIIPDSFLNHASGGLNKKGIVIFGNTSPQIYGYDNNYNLWYAPPCSPCRLQDPVDAAVQEDCCIKDGIPVEYENLNKNVKILISLVL